MILNRIQSYGIWVLMALVLALYSSISLGNHSRFRTYGFDLGIKNQTLWYYSNGLFCTSSLISELEKPDGNTVHILVNHFEIILIPLAPLIWITGSYTLLWIQALSLVLGGLGIYLIAKDRLNAISGLAIALYFYTHWAVLSALGFDFHTNTLSASLFPWLWYALEKKRFALFWLFALLMLMCKETVAFWLFFVGIGFALTYRKTHQIRNQALMLSMTSLIWFLLVMIIIVPALGGKEVTYFHFQYSALGNNIGEALNTLVKKPFYAIKMLWISPLEPGEFGYDYKLLFYSAMALSGGVVCWLYPSTLIMAFPLLAAKMWNDSPARWSPFFHYSVEMVPLMALAIIELTAKIKPLFFKRAFVLLFVIAGLLTTRQSLRWYRAMDWARYGVDFMSPKHYSRSFDIYQLRQCLSEIPKDDAIAANDFVIPHLAFRQKIYQLPVLKDAKWFVLVDDGRRYPDFFESEALLETLLATGEWETICSHNTQIRLLKKKTPIS
jgi:uncharacterized membrane protein